MLRSSAFLSGRAEFYLSENVIVGFFSLLPSHSCLPSKHGKKSGLLQIASSLAWLPWLEGSHLPAGQEIPRSSRVLWALGGRLTQPRGCVPGCQSHPQSKCSVQSAAESNPDIFRNGEQWTRTQQLGAVVFLEHVAGEFALRNLSFLECRWINDTYLFNLKSSHSPHFWAALKELF